VSDRRLRAAVAALALVGLGIAGYLTYTRYSGAPIVCSTGGCETVQRSSHSTIAGIPVAVLGLVAYAFVLLTALGRSEPVRVAGATAALVGVLFATWLLYAQIGPIHAICQWCVASDVVISLLAVATVLRAIERDRARPA
jgi:uncharacterized membrane protein